MREPIKLSMNNGLDKMWVSDDNTQQCEYLISLGDWGEIGLNESELDSLIEALRRIKNHL